MSADEFGLPDNYPGSTRTIQHIVPLDGAAHVLVECFCHPSITEANQTAALMGFDDAGVPASEAGALIFQHSAVASFTETEIRLEPTPKTQRSPLAVARGLAAARRAMPGGPEQFRGR